jgi:hypothetical protein
MELIMKMKLPHDGALESDGQAKERTLLKAG